MKINYFKHRKKPIIFFNFLIVIFLGAVFFPVSIKAAPSVILDPVTQACAGAVRTIDLTWTSSEIEAEVPVYYILRKLSAEENYIGDISGPLNSATYTDSAISSGKIYSYKIKMEYGVDVFYSNEIIVGANYCSPQISQNISLCEANGPHNNLAWTSASGDLARYEIWRDGAKIKETNNLSVSDDLNISGTSSYNYFIKTVWVDGVSRDSGIVSVTALACPPILNINSGCKNDMAPGGPIIDLSWNNLLGATKYDIYRKLPGANSYSIVNPNILLASPYVDNLVTSFPQAYWQEGNIQYYIKTFFANELSVDSPVTSIDVKRCNPFLITSGVCDMSGNPEMRFSWTRTMDASNYDIYRGGNFLIQKSGNYPSNYENCAGTSVNSETPTYFDCLSPVVCPGNICTHNYEIKASVPNINEYFISNIATQNIDCATITPPSSPILNDLALSCDAGNSKIELSWTPSDNAIYYTIYRNNTPLINWSNSSYADVAIASGVEYSYYVVAFGRGGTSSAISNLKIASAVSCASPGNSTLALSKSCSLGVPQVTLLWTPTANTTNYEIKKGTSEANMETKNNFVFGNTTWTDSDNLLPNTSYYYQIFSGGVLGVTPSPSNNAFITTSNCFPTIPAVAVVPECSGGGSRIKVSWTSDNQNTQRYEISREGIGLLENVEVIPNNYSYERFYNVSSGNLYKYKVEAVGFNIGQRSTQGYKSATSYFCNAPTDFTLSAPSLTCQESYPRVSLNWQNSSNATSYNVIRNRFTPPETVVFPNKTSPFVDSGFGNALSFDGVNDYLKTKTFSISNTDNVITFNAWINSSKKTTYQTLISDGSSVSTMGNLWVYRTPNSDSLNWQFANGVSNSRLSSSSSFFTGYDNQWLMLTIVVNYNAKNAKFYRNGQLINTANTSTNMLYPDIDNIKYIGANGSSSHFFNGLIDEVRVYTRALSLAEIQDRYRGVFSNENNLIALWHFDEGAGQSFSDSSGEDNNGVLGSDLNIESFDPIWKQNSLNFESQYNWKIEASGPGGNIFSNTTSWTQMPVCAPVKAGLELDGICQGGTKGAIKLNWSYSLNAVKYEIYRNGAWIKTITSAEPEFISRSWVDDYNGVGLTQKGLYSYYINSVGSTGLITQSIVQTQKVPLCVLPEAPQNVTSGFGCPVPGVSGVNPQIKIQWDDVTNASYYTVYRNNMVCGGLPASPTRFCPLPNTESNFYLDDYPSVNVNTEYIYMVKAINAAGQSDFSAPTSIPPGKYCTPSIPIINSLVTDCKADNTPVNTLSWSDATVFNTQKYQIERKLGAGNFTPLITINKGTPDFIARIWNDDAGLSATSVNSTSYRIKAIGPNPANLSSNYSTVQTKNTYICDTTPAPALLNSVAPYCFNNKPYADVLWTDSANAFSYNLKRENITDNVTKIYSTILSPKSDNGSRALKFDGQNDYVDIPSTISNPNGLTIEAWVKPDTFVGFDANQTIYLAGAPTAASGFSWIYITSSRIYYKFATSSGIITIFSPTLAWTSSWYYLTVVHNYSTKSITFYRNGSLIGSSSYSSVLIPVSDKPIKIGASSANQNRFHGLIDEIRVYDRALIDSDVTKHYTNNYENETALQGAWHFDEKNTTKVYDSSGNGRNGKIAGPEWSESAHGGALQFGGIDGFVQLPSFNIGQASTIEAWVYLEKTPKDYARIIDFGDGSANNNIILGFKDSGKMFLETYQGSVSGGQIKTPTVLPLNQWVHIAAVIDGHNKGFIYWNGDEKNHGTVGVPLSLSRSNQFIGKSNWSPDPYFEGKIDEFRIFRRALTQAEIEAHKNGIFSNDPSLAISLPFDEKSGVIAVDSSGKSGNADLKIGAERVNSDFSTNAVTTLETGKSYKYSVQAVGINNSSISNTLSLSNTLSCLPVAPTININPSTCDGLNTQVSLAWDPDSNVSYWTIYKDAGFGFTPIINTSLNSYVDTDVASGVNYTYYIKAYGFSSNIQETSAQVTKYVTTCSNPPETPIISGVDKQCAGSSSRLKVNWSLSNTNNILSLSVYRINSALGEIFDMNTPIAQDLNKDNIYFIDSSVSYKTGATINKYQYIIKSVGNNQSAVSLSSVATETFDCSNIEPQPFALSENISATYSASSDGDSGKASVKWTNSEGENYYKIFRRIYGESNFAYEAPRNRNNHWLEFLKNIFMEKTLAADYSSPLATFNLDIDYADSENFIYYTDYSVAEDTKYQYQAVAYNSKGIYNSNIINVNVPKAFPGSFTASYTKISPGKIKLNWTEAATTPISGPITYKIIKSSENDFSSSETACSDILDDDPINNPKRNCQDDSFSSAKKYYRIAATNQGGTREVELIISVLSNWKEVVPR